MYVLPIILINFDSCPGVSAAFSEFKFWNMEWPLFYFPRSPLLGEANGEDMRGNILTWSTTTQEDVGCFHCWKYQEAINCISPKEY
jgi:hypothetical protein